MMEKEKIELLQKDLWMRMNNEIMSKADNAIADILYELLELLKGPDNE